MLIDLNSTRPMTGSSHAVQSTALRARTRLAPSPLPAVLADRSAPAHLALALLPAVRADLGAAAPLAHAPLRRGSEREKSIQH